VSEVTFLEALGMTVVEVPGLSVEVCYVEDVNVGLVRAGLTPQARRQVYDWLLSAAGEGYATAS